VTGCLQNPLPTSMIHSAYHTKLTLPYQAAGVIRLLEARERTCMYHHSCKTCIHEKICTANHVQQCIKETIYSSHWW